MLRLIREVLRVLGLRKPLQPHPDGRYYDIPGLDFEMDGPGTYWQDR